MSPGNEQFEYWGSQSAAREGSANYGGIADEAVDMLVKQVVFANDREELVAATEALDRVLLANQFVIPSYTSRVARIAYSSRLVHPDPLPGIRHRLSDNLVVKGRGKLDGSAGQNCKSGTI